MIELYTTAGEFVKLNSVEELKNSGIEFQLVQFQDATSQDLAWIRTEYGLDLTIMTQTEDIEISSHFHENEQQAAFHFSLPYYKHKDVLIEESYFMIISKGQFFTFSSSALDQYLTEIYAYKFETIREKLAEKDGMLILQIEFLADYYADITENIAKRIKQLAERIMIKKEFNESDLDVITQLNFNNLLIKESINEFSRILMLQKKSNRNAQSQLREKIENELTDLAVVSDYIQFNFDRLDDLKENISNKIELEQNKIFKLLTIITFCISVPTLIAGIYGMNFKHMPELNSQYGYFFVLIAMILSVVLPLIYFKRKKWL